MLADVLGCDPLLQRLRRALAQATPEQLAEIKKAELSFEARMKELEVDVFELETKDIQNARTNFSTDWTARTIGLIMVMFFCVFCAYIVVEPPGSTSMELINLILGYLGGLVSAVVSFISGRHRSRNKL